MFILATRVEHAPLEAIYIYIDTATYNEIERDVKVKNLFWLWICAKKMQVTTEAQLGLIGGTMGLLTGFSILSGVEIVFFLIKIFVKVAKDGKGMLTTRNEWKNLKKKKKLH